MYLSYRYYRSDNYCLLIYSFRASFRSLLQQNALGETVSPLPEHTAKQSKLNTCVAELLGQQAVSTRPRDSLLLAVANWLALETSAAVFVFLSQGTITFGLILLVNRPGAFSALGSIVFQAHSDFSPLSSFSLL